MENLTRLNSQVDALISALRSAQDETTQLRKELEEDRATGVEKDTYIRSLEIICEEKDYRILTLEDDISKKDDQLEVLVARIEQVLSTLPNPVELVKSVSAESNT
ncbi:hypothetical protein CCP3SC5AM1_1240006 [Gammaproteobacteria bacterium]